MNDLSNTSDPTAVPTPPVQPQQPSHSVSSGSKEIVGGSMMNDELLRDSTGSEYELPKEVSASGVRIQPTSIPIPQPVAKMGVTPAGQNVPVPTVTSIPLPLSDDQIAAGLHAGITESIRWLAEWCVLRLKHVHLVLKNVHGKFMRVREVN